MRTDEFLPDDHAPRRILIMSRDELDDAMRMVMRRGRLCLRFLHRNLSLFDLASVDASESLSRLLASDRNARIRMLVDDAAWLETRAPRLRLLQRRFPHALELRIASTEDPVGDDAYALADDRIALELKPSRTARGDLWLNNKPRAQPLLAGFDRRWDAAAHNLPVQPLGL